MSAQAANIVFLIFIGANPANDRANGACNQLKKAAAREFFTDAAKTAVSAAGFARGSGKNALFNRLQQRRFSVSVLLRFS
jgi:hypothetical protein